MARDKRQTRWNAAVPLTCENTARSRDSFSGCALQGQASNGQPGSDPDSGLPLRHPGLLRALKGSLAVNLHRKSATSNELNEEEVQEPLCILAPQSHSSRAPLPCQIFYKPPHGPVSQEQDPNFGLDLCAGTRLF